MAYGLRWKHLKRFGIPRARQNERGIAIYRHLGARDKHGIRAERPRMRVAGNTALALAEAPKGARYGRDTGGLLECAAFSKHCNHQSVTTNTSSARQQRES